MNDTIRIRKASQADQATILSMVASNQLNIIDLNWRHFVVAVSGDDRREHAFADRIIGCGQIRSHGKLQELASLVVAPEYRGRGVSARLMEALLDDAGRPLWLICESGLVDFYQAYQFQEVTEPAELPAYFQAIYWTSRTAFAWLFMLRGSYLAFMCRKS